MALCKKVVHSQRPYYEKYKSAGERRIADFLDKNHLQFSYEKPLAVIDNGHTKLFYPDFLLHDFNTIIEYFGIGGNLDYNARANRKIEIYRENHIPLISIYPHDFANGWQEKILGFLSRDLDYRNDVLDRIKQSR